MTDDERAKAMALDAIRRAAVVLTLETEHEGKQIVVKYHAAVALDRQRISTTPASAPALTVVTYLVDLVAELSINGQPAPVGRRGMSMPIAALFCWDLLGKIMDHATDWAEEQNKQGQDSLIVQSAIRAAHRPARLNTPRPKRKRR